MHIAVLSPYDFHARSEAACAALLLAQCVVTVRPAPLEGISNEQLHIAATDAPAFAELVRAWSWSGPLWQAGVIRGEWDAAVPIDDIQRAAREIADGGGPLAGVVGDSPFEDTHAYLQAMSHDVMGGGRDPGVAVPVAIGLERFASRHGLAIIRGPGRSLSSKFEARSTRRITQVTTTMVVGADAGELLALRESAHEELSAFREAIHSGPEASDALTEAGDALSDAVLHFLESADDGLSGAAIRLTFGSTEAGSVQAGALSALGAKSAEQASTGASGSGTELSHRPTQIVSVRTLPWAIESR